MEDAPLDPDEDDEMEEEGDEMEEEEMEYEETNSSGTEPSVDEGEEDADHEQDMDVGMEDGQDATWIDEVDEAGTEEDDDAESLPDPIVEAEADIVWQGNPEDDVIVDAVHVDQDDPVDGGNDDGAFRIVLSDGLYWTHRSEPLQKAPVSLTKMLKGIHPQTTKSSWIMPMPWLERKMGVG